jgi:hypothetical protein
VEGLALEPGVSVKRGKAELNGCEPGAVDDDEVALLIGAGEDVWRGVGGCEGEEEFEWINIGENGEEKGEVDPHGGRVVEAEAAEEVEVR